MKKLLVFDLDETLIHATDKSDYKHHFIVGPYIVFKRPYLEKFLNFCDEYFEIGIWTSSTEDYANGIIEEIIPEHIDIRFLWSRDRCIREMNHETDEIHWVKDLKKLKRKGYSLSNIVVIDDSPEKLKRQYGNLVKVEPFFGDNDDTELEKLEDFLKTLTNVENIRIIEKRNWKRYV